MRKSEACNNCSREVTNRIELSAATKAHSLRDSTHSTRVAKTEAHTDILCILYMVEGHVAVTRIHTLSHDCSHLIRLPRFGVVIRKPGKRVTRCIFPLSLPRNISCACVPPTRKNTAGLRDYANAAWASMSSLHSRLFRIPFKQEGYF